MIRTLTVSALAGLWIIANSATGIAEESAVMMVRHHVADYAKWRAVFDGQEDVRKASGLDNVRVYQSADSPDEVVILIDAADLQRARAFAGSEDLKARMINAGVKGKPDILFLTIAN